jgi:hypothetical protein
MTLALRARQPIRDGLILAWRYLKRVPRIPELAIFAVLQSIMFVLLFAFVFGGAIPLPGGGNYREFLMPGIFAQTIAFASATTAIGMADDMAKGIIDRFRSLPMARSAVLVGRTFSDVLYNTGILFVLMAAGLAVGWTVGAQRGGRPAGRLHDDLPADLHLERLRAAADAARLPAPNSRVEPRLDPRLLAARAVG